ncbi:hypothetical protein Tco_0889405 [Tanacetum coccineum]
MLELMRDVLDARMLIEHHDDGGVVVFTSRAWRRLFDIRGLLVRELILEFLSTLRFGESESERMIPGKGDLHNYWRSISTDGDFLGPPPFYTLIRDLVLRLCHRMMAHSIAGRSQAPEKVTVTDLFYLRGLDVGSFIARLSKHFGLLTEERLQGLTVIIRELLVIDMAELVRLQICKEIDDTWAGAPGAAEDAPVVDEGNQAILVPVQEPQQPPPPPPAAGRTMPQRLGRLEEEVHGLRQDFMEASGQTYQALYGAFRGSSPAAFQRRTRQRTDGASTSATQQDQQQPDP